MIVVNLHGRRLLLGIADCSLPWADLKTAKKMPGPTGGGHYGGATQEACKAYKGKSRRHENK